MEIKPTINIDDFAKIDFRVATILATEPHGDRLIKMQIDLGAEKRQILSSIRKYYDPASLIGRQIIVVVNLEPRTMRGEVSNGMLLAASSKDGDELRDVILLQPDKQVPPGSTVG